MLCVYHGYTSNFLWTVFNCLEVLFRIVYMPSIENKKLSCRRETARTSCH